MTIAPGGGTREAAPAPAPPGRTRALLARAANLSLRVGSTGARFLLTVVLTKWVGLDAAGEYAIFLTSATLLGQLVGADYFTFSMREMAGRTPAESRAIVDTQYALFGRTFAIGALLAPIPFVTGFIPWRFFAAFVAIAALEQIAQELYRVLVSMRRPVWANICYVLRSAAWVPVVAAAAALTERGRSLHFVYVSWLVGVALSVVVAAVLISRLAPGLLRRRPHDPALLREGLRAAAPFFLASVCVNVVEYADRYFLAAWVGAAEVGAYWLFRGITNLVLMGAYFGVYEFKFPELAAAFGRGDEQAFAEHARAMAIGAIAVTVLAVVVGSVLAVPLLRFVGSPRLLQMLDTFYLLLLGSALASAATGLTFLLNARRRDAAVLPPTAMAGAVSLGANALLIPSLGMRGAAFAFIAGTVVRAGWLAVEARRSYAGRA